MGLRKLAFLNLITLVIVYFGLSVLNKPQIVKKIEGSTKTQYFASEPKLFDNLKVGNLDLSLKTIPAAETLIQTYENKRTYINFPHRRVQVSYADLGVSFDLQVLENYIDSCLVGFPNCKVERPLKKLRDVLVSLNMEIFNEFVDSLNESVKSLLLSPDLSFDEGTFKANDLNAKIRIDSDALYSQLTPDLIFSETDITISTVILNPDPTRQRQLTEELVSKVVSYSLLIKYGRQPVDIEPDQLSIFVKVEETGTESIAVISPEEISKYLDSLREKYPISVDLEHEAAIYAILYALLFRVGGEDPETAVILPLQGGPSTDGTYANKYLELNKTQQRLYVFENGSLIKTYIVGTGLTWETPAGNFKILRKTKMAMSYTGGWYMPYYMPVGTVYGYFFGFHEIPYRKNAQGQITSRDVNTMGSPATGGCIQLYRKDAVALHEWADIGIPVLIHD